MTSEAQQLNTPLSVNNRKPLKGGPVLGTLRFLFRGLGPIVPRQMGKFAYRLWFTPKRLARPEREKALLQREHDHYQVTGHGQKASVRAWGQGPAVLMIHGWEGRGTQFSNFVDALLTKGFRVITFDMPAHGDSEGKQTDLVEIEKVISQIKEREGELRGVVAHSFGGVAAAFAFRKGLKAERAVFINSPSRFKTMLAFFQNQLTIPMSVMKEMMKCIENRFPEMGPDLWEILDTAGNVSTLSFPGLVFHDEGDKIVPISQGELIAEAWPDVQMERTRGLGHHRILRDSGVIEKTVSFLTF